ncbi:unnamed protein product, partial [Hapterophycus canaliculatus]
MGQFDRPPTVAGHADYQYGIPLSESGSEWGEEEHHRRILRPVLDFLVLAAALLPLKLWWNLVDEQCWDPSTYKATELTLLRVTRGVWIAWLTHAAGLFDEALRVFLGIRLTMGLGSPTSVDKTYTKMSRRVEVVAEGIAVDDFPALVGLYAGAQPPAANKRASSGTLRGGGGGEGGGGAGDGASYAARLAAARGRVNKSLVMRVEKIAATAELWSLVPWSSVRRYDRVHVKGITLRLRQVNGILNFSFVALKKKGRRGGVGGGGGACRSAGGEAGGGTAEMAAAAAAAGRRNLSFGGGLGVGGAAGGAAVGAHASVQSNSRSLEDLDAIDTEGEEEDATDVDELLDEDEDEEDEEEGDGACYQLADDADLLAA